MQGKASLTTAEQLSKGLGRAAFPPALSDQFTMEAVKFTDGWNSDMGLAGLELMDINNPEAITPERPLKISLAAILKILSKSLL